MKFYSFTIAILLLLPHTASAQTSPQLTPNYILRGMNHFTANRITESLQDFDRAAALDPAGAPKLWQRGISQYYAGKFADGRLQFETHKKVNPHDVENATWHFLCVARMEGVEQARKTLIKIDTSRDTRVPMAEVYQFYAGQGTKDTLLKAAELANTEVARMYAHLYLGLFYEVAGENKNARQHLFIAADAKLRGNYMHEVAKIHLLQRRWKR